MQAFCQRMQRDAVAELQQLDRRSGGIPDEAYRVASGRCATDWPTDFSMQAFCLKEQIEGYQAVTRGPYSPLVDVKPEEGYGVRNEGMVQDLPRDSFKGVERVEPGMQFEARTERGPLLVTVVEVADDRVRIDGNHPLAGQTLHFDVRVLDVREATEDEKQNGRAAQA